MHAQSKRGLSSMVLTDLTDLTTLSRTSACCWCSRIVTCTETTVHENEAFLVRSKILLSLSHGGVQCAKRTGVVDVVEGLYLHAHNEEFGNIDAKTHPLRSHPVKSLNNWLPASYHTAPVNLVLDWKLQKVRNLTDFLLPNWSFYFAFPEPTNKIK